MIGYKVVSFCKFGEVLKSVFRKWRGEDLRGSKKRLLVEFSGCLVVVLRKVLKMINLSSWVEVVIF